MNVSNSDEQLFSTPETSAPDSNDIPLIPPTAPLAEPPSLFTQSGRPWRPICLPARYVDHLPAGPAPLPLIAPGSTALPRVILHVRDALETARNVFGLRRVYSHRPSHDPDAAVPDGHLSTYYAKFQPCDDVPTNISRSDEHLAPWPFKNMSTYLLMEWMHTGSQHKSEGEVDRLAQSVLSHPEFNVQDISNFSAQAQGAILDKSDSKRSDALPFLADGWQETSVEISVPLGTHDDRGLCAPFKVPGLHYRSLLSVMKAALTDITALRFHFSPFKKFWKPHNGPEQRVFDEAYTSDAWIEEHDQIQKQPNEPGCKLEKVILGLMFWSDATHLTNFGTAKLCPLYMYIGNLSKYFRGKPGSAAAHHIAYIPSVGLLLY